MLLRGTECRNIRKVGNSLVMMFVNRKSIFGQLVLVFIGLRAPSPFLSPFQSFFLLGVLIAWGHLKSLMFVVTK